MSYKRKTKDVYQVQCNYGQGFEEVFSSENFTEARNIKKDYINNDSYALSIRLITKREKIQKG